MGGGLGYLGRKKQTRIYTYSPDLVPGRTIYQQTLRARLWYHEWGREGGGVARAVNGIGQVVAVLLLF